jgi:ABC-type polysaccharide/polyol phosphate transport system ATPase subunit
MPANAIEVRDVFKVYRRYGHRRQFATLKSAILSGSFVSDLKADETFEALKGVSFDVARGRTYGIIGRNGSGKSTMLKCVAGITRPTRGTVTVNGRISALIELGAGFHPEISGRENVFINGIMLGLSKKEITRRFDEIVQFAELEDFIDAPVKTYSSGMYMRLGFAVAIHVDPDVLLVDEVLAVGDEGFTHKCLDKFSDFRRRGKTILLVTHSLGLVERFCDEALWLDGGKVRATGDPRRVVGAYVTAVEEGEEALLAREDARAREAATAASSAGGPPIKAPDDPVTVATSGPSPAGDAPEPTPADMFLASAGRWGSREVEIAGVTLIGDEGPGHIFHANEKLIVRLDVKSAAPVTDFVFGFGLFNADGVCVYGTNTDVEDLDPQEISGAGQVDLVIEPLGLIEGTYKIDVAVHRRDGYPYDYHRLLYTFRVKSRTKDVGIYRPPHSWVFSQGVKLTTRI